MSRLSEFLSMGGYASYVWSAYGMTALVLLYNTFRAKAMRKQVMNKTRQWLAKAGR